MIGIVARSRDNTIGVGNKLPWNLPEDLKYFKEKTIGGTVIMGRKTFDSIGKPLPIRHNIVVSRDKELEVEGVEVYTDINKLLDFYGDCENVFIIGGAEIYKLFEDYIDTWLITEVCIDIGSGTKLGIDMSNFRLVETITRGVESDIDYIFNKYALID